MSFISFNWYESLLANFKKLLNNKADLINGKVPDEQLSDYIRSKPDWNENKPDSATYIKNRTHYSEGTTTTDNVTVYVEETTIETASQYGDSGLFEFKPSLNTKYIVIFDGVEYECDSYFTNYGRIGVGGDSTPFFMEYDDYNQEIVITTNGLGVHTIRIISIETVTTEHVQKLDKKYLDMSWEALDDKPFEDKGRENLFTIVYLNDNEGTDSGYVAYQAGIRKLNRYASYDFVIRGDVYKNVKPSCVYNSYYNWISWGGPSVYAGWPLGNYPFCLDTQFADEYDENGDIMTATGMPIYGSYFYVNAEVYPYLDIATEVQVYLSSDDGIKRIDSKYMPKGYPSEKCETKIIYNNHLTISEDNPFIFEVGIPDLVRGQAYTVILDNVEYNCIAVDDGYGGEALGNFYVVGEGEDTGEPFFIFEEYNDNPYACGIAVNTAGDHTVSIKTSVEEIVTIDPKFIQDAYYTETQDVVTFGSLKIRNTSSCSYMPGESFDLVPGVVYTIDIDGSKYTCTAYEIDGIPMLGNGSLRGYSHPNSAEYVPVFVCVPNKTGEWDVEIWGSDAVIGSYHNYVIYGTIETVHKIDSKYLPDPFQFGKVELIPEVTFNAVVEEGHNNCYVVENPFHAELEENKTYFVTFDGVEYECIGYVPSYYSKACVGDSFSIIQCGGLHSQKGEPFVYIQDTDTLYVTSPGMHTISIKKAKEIDSAYLPYLNISNGEGQYSTVQGVNSSSTGDYSHSEGYYTTASGDCSHSEGDFTKASGYTSHAEGYVTTASGSYSHSGGYYTTASGYTSHAEGYYTTASGSYSHAEGYRSIAYGNSAHAEGGGTTNMGTFHIKITGSGVNYTVANESYVSDRLKVGNIIEYNNKSYKITEVSDFNIVVDKSMADWVLNNVTVDLCYDITIAAGNYSHAEGYATTASGQYSHTEGNNTIAHGDYQHAQGKYNIEDKNNTYAHIVGNGESNTARSNAHTIDWDGNAWFQGDVYVGSTSGTNKDDGSKKLATTDDIETAMLIDETELTTMLEEVLV